MKKILFLFVVAYFIVACGTPSAEITTVDSVKVDSISTSVDTVKVDTVVVPKNIDTLKK